MNINLSESRTDICIVGAGVAGSVMAAYLGKNGKMVTIIEKNWEEQDRIVGELLQPGGVKKLYDMGLEFLLENIDAQEVKGYALFLNSDNFKISYPETENPIVKGLGFRNGKFVQNVRKYIQSLPNVRTVSGTVNELVDIGKKITGVKFTPIENTTSQEIQANLTIVCEGPFSNLRNELSVPEKKINGYFLGLVLKNCHLPYENHGHVIIAQPSPFLLYPISTNETRILIDFPGNKPPKMGSELKKYLRETISPQIPASARTSFLESVEEGKFKIMPNHHLPASPVFKQGAVLIGDSLNMRHPLTGGGMTVAFTDIQNLGSKLIKVNNFQDEDLLQHAVRSFYETRHKETATINILADALYKVMSNEDLKNACYNYLKRGGKYASEPISILSAISRNRMLLQQHFFAVALYGAKKTISPFPNLKNIKRSHKMISEAVKIIDPLIRNEHPDFITKSTLRASKVFF